MEKEIQQSIATATIRMAVIMMMTPDNDDYTDNNSEIVIMVTWLCRNEKHKESKKVD